MRDLPAWLEEVRNCEHVWVSPQSTFTPNPRHLHKLTVEFGLYDNWPILLRGDYERIGHDFLDGALNSRYVPARTILNPSPESTEGSYILDPHYDGGWGVPAASKPSQMPAA